MTLIPHSLKGALRILSGHAHIHHEVIIKFFFWRFSMKPGSLVRYWNMDDVPVLGVVTSDPYIDIKLGPLERVDVHWLDDAQKTTEEVYMLLDPEKDYMEIISSA